MREADLAGLLVALAEGRDEAFTELVERFGPALLRTAQTLTGSQAEAEDVVQETLVALVRTRAQLPLVQNFTAYLFTVLRHAARRQVERRERERRKGLAWADRAAERTTTDRVSHETDRLERLREAVARLPLEQRELLALKLDAGLTFREIAEQLSMNSNTVASRYRSAMQTLREMLQDPTDE